MYKKFRSLNKSWQLFITLAVIICLLLIIFVTVFYWQVQSAAKSMYIYPQHEYSLLRAEPIQLEKAPPITILLLGVDERGEDRGRADTIVVATINPEKQSTYMLSIPRDTYVDIPSLNMKDKINHAYAYGGIHLTTSTVEQLIQIPVDYVFTFKMEGFTRLIDVLGGVDVQNKFAFTYEGERFEKGNLTLNGEQALRYVRMRYEDPEGDFGRQNRQKQVLQGAMKKAFTFNTMLKFQQLLAIAENHFETTATTSELLQLQRLYKESAKRIEHLHLTNGQGKLINNIYYFLPNIELVQRLQVTLQNHLYLQ